MRAERVRILSTLRDQVDRLSERAATAMSTEIPAYADRDTAFHREVVAQCEVSYRTLIDALLQERTVLPEEVAFIKRAAIRRARTEFALADYINAFRVGHHVFWEAVVECAGSSSAAHEAALTLTTPLIRYNDIVSTLAANTYLDFQRYAISESTRENRDLLEALLAGEPPRRGPLLAAAHVYGLGPHTPALAVVATPLDGALGPETLYAAGGFIARAAETGTRALTVTRGTEIISIPTPPPGAGPARLCERLEDACGRLLKELEVTLAVGVSTIATDFGEIPRAYQEARAALDLVPGDGGVAALPLLSPFRYMALRADDVTRRLVDPRVEALLAEDRIRGGVLTETIQAFAEADLNSRAAAKALQIHHKTAQYRLRRVEELTGLNPRRIHNLIDLLIAIELRKTPAAR
ncbi:hypothetical protein GCM10022252_79210 [Streptosporangium oxazolinicum]|uniref:Transcriptional regulator n=1 Tax=Streptosporangium oxazolinicum TaxID=909287 RepID=A0ABP8BN10_9ACTN